MCKSLDLDVKAGEISIQKWTPPQQRKLVLQFPFSLVKIDDVTWDLNQFLAYLFGKNCRVRFSLCSRCTFTSKNSGKLMDLSLSKHST
jgi:hypothetical protein